MANAGREGGETGLAGRREPCDNAAGRERDTGRRHRMTNTVAAWLAALLIAGGIADMTLNEGQVLFLLAVKLTGLIEWAAFWR
jgi:hypothetical protein